MDWVIISTPDMYMTKESIRNLLDYLENNTKDDDRAVGCVMKTYWKDFDTIVKPDWDFNTVAIRPTQRFEYSARLENTTAFKQAPGVTVHHLSWIKTDEEMLSKITTYSHATEINSNWYRDVWLNWNPTITNFHPTSPTDYKKVVKYPLPDEIRELLC